jgi:hypothetical protein
MFHQIQIITSTDTQGNQYTSIRRWDNHGKLGYTGNHCGDGRMYRTGNTERIDAVLRGMGYHYMSVGTYGKLFA